MMFTRDPRGHTGMLPDHKGGGVEKEMEQQWYVGGLPLHFGLRTSIQSLIWFGSSPPSRKNEYNMAGAFNELC